MIENTIWNLTKMQKGIVSKLSLELDHSLMTRLLEMGLAPKEEVLCLRTTPMGGPKVFQIRDSVFSLEKSIAEKIYIEGL